jgi:two-component system, chemotaxis family, protein-glutamate methylesterase/glutaminase
MNSLPETLPSDGDVVLTGLVCPDCRGALTLRMARRLVQFTCRVGHAYSPEELVAGKEGALESRMWEAVYAFDEMAALLVDLVRHGLADGVGTTAAQERGELARAHAARLRSIIQADRPVDPRPAVGRPPDQATPS